MADQSPLLTPNKSKNEQNAEEISEKRQNE